MPHRTLNMPASHYVVHTITSQRARLTSSIYLEQEVTFRHHRSLHHVQRAPLAAPSCITVTTGGLPLIYMTVHRFRGTSARGGLALHLKPRPLSVACSSLSMTARAPRRRCTASGSTPSSCATLGGRRTTERELHRGLGFLRAVVHAWFLSRRGCPADRPGCCGGTRPARC
jgi:hypothetical protein